MTSHSPDSELTDDEIGQRFLEELHAELAATLDDFGRSEWRKVRAGQILRLRSLGWTTRDLADHYHLTRGAITAILAKGGVTPTRWHIEFSGTHADLTAVRELLDERGITATVGGE